MTLRALGIHHRPHDLRHSFATEIAQRANGNLVIVAKLMGHESVLTTERYVAWTPESTHLVNQMYL